LKWELQSSLWGRLSTKKYYNTDYRVAVMTFVSIIYDLNHIRDALLNKNFSIGPSFLFDVVPIVLLLTLD